MEHKHISPSAGTTRSRANIALIVFMFVAAFFLITEHWAHVSGWFRYWPYLLLLACPVMHLFMHGGHGHGGHGESKTPSDSNTEKR